MFVAFLTLALLKGAFSLSHEDASAHIQSYVESYKTPGIGGLCATNTCCNITATQSCPLSNMAKDKSTLVLPGGETRCIFSTSTPFAFQVIPGDSDKLVFYLQGGGACWDEMSTSAGTFCTTDVAPQSLVGIFNRNNDKNAFKSYTIVHVAYCSGDVHGGNVVRPYNDKAGQPVVQKGLANVQSALDWVVQQQSKGALSSTLADLVIMGCSAGSIGAQLWGDQVVSKLKWSKAAIMPDSYAGDFPDGTMGPLVYGYGFCSSGFLSDALYKKCMDQTLTLMDIDAEFIASKPTVPWAFIQSKTDIVQQSFYVSVGISMNASQKSITPSQFYSDVNDIFGGYNINKNFVTYLVDGDQHCFTCYDLIFEADGKGAHDNGATNTQEMMSTWANRFPLASGASADTICEGALKGEAALEDNTYCSSKVNPKTYTEHY